VSSNFCGGFAKSGAKVSGEKIGPAKKMFAFAKKLVELPPRFP
jgi:hypothetical protein